MKSAQLLDASKVERLRSALESAKANILDHQGCIMPPHLIDAVTREIDAALMAEPAILPVVRAAR